MKFFQSIGKILLITGMIPFWASCDTATVYNAYEDIDDGLWYVKNKPVFKIEIKDTTLAYNVYYLLRNERQYPYYNLYLTREMKNPDGTVSPTQLDELYLSNEKTGKPYGNGLGDLYDHKIILKSNYRFPRSGIYTFTLGQSMRQDPLPSILGIGIQVEKAGVK